MEKFYGNYLGLCINNDDPEKRGRTQIFIPHIMPALYENWNEAGDDIKLICVGNNIPDSLPDNILEKLKLTLPWAESASPIMGTSAPGNLVGAPSYSQTPGNNSYNQSPVPNAAGYAGDAATGGPLGAGATGDANFDALAAIARGEGVDYSRSRSLCGIGTRRMVGALLGSGSYFNQGMGGNASSCAIGGASGSGSTNNFYQKSGYYSAPVRVDSNYLNDPSQWRTGDVIAARNAGSAGPGHQQTYLGGGQWSSDFPQGSKVLQNGYTGFTLHRLNDRGLAQLQAAGNVNNFAIAGAGAPANAPTGSGYETPSTSGQLAAATPHQSEAPIGTTATDPSSYGSVADPKVAAASGGTMGGPLPEVQSNADGSVNQASLRNYLTQRITNSNLNGYKPADGAKYGVDGSVNSWVNHFMSVAKNESGFKNSSTNRADPGGSIGLFQVSTFDGSRYGANPTGGNWTEAQLRNPANNANTAVAIYERNVLRDGQIAGPSGKGAGGYYAALTMNKVAAEAANGTIGSFDPNAPASPAAEIAASSPPGQLVHNKDPHGTAAVMDLNNMASGMFSFPAAGSLLWCFFREGNPLYPVYFAASYSQGEWQSAYRYNVASPAQDGVGYKPAASPDSPTTSVGGAWNIGKVGAIAWTDETDPNDPKNNQKSLMIGGHDGSNMFFNEGYHQIFSKFDRRDQVEGDRWETTLGQKEEWVQGDSNLVVMGDMFIKIGNVGPEAVQSVEKIQSIIKECMQPLTQGGDCGGSGGGGSGTKSSFTKQAEKNSTIKPPAANSFGIPTGSALSNTNNITTPNLPGVPQAAPAPVVTPSSPAIVNQTSTAINPAVSNPWAQGTAPNKSVKIVVGGGFRL